MQGYIRATMNDTKCVVKLPVCWYFRSLENIKFKAFSFFFFFFFFSRERTVSLCKTSERLLAPLKTFFYSETIRFWKELLTFKSKHFIQMEKKGKSVQSHMRTTFFYTENSSNYLCSDLCPEIIKVVSFLVFFFYLFIYLLSKICFCYITLQFL